MTKKKKITLAVTATLVLGIAGYAIAATGGGDQTGPNIGFVTATRQTLETSITAQGEVALLGTGDVAFVANTLEVEEVLVHVNDVVTAGQPLIRFNANLQERNRQRDQLNHQLRDTRLLLSSQQVSLQAMRLGATTLEIENANLNISRAEQGIRDAELALAQLESNITLQKSAISIAHRDVEAAERGVEQVQSNLADAQNTLSNTQLLFNAGAATQVQLDNATRHVETLTNEVFNAQTRVSNAQAALINSQAQLQTLQNQILQAQSHIHATTDNHRLAEIQLTDLQNRASSPQNLNAISQQQIAIQRTQLAITDIERNLANLDEVEDVLLAPASGTVTAINVVAGAMAQPGATLIAINDPGNYVIRAFVNERHAWQLALGQPVLVEGSILGGEVLHGAIQNIATIATTSNIAGVNERVVPIEVAVSHLDTQLLLPGVTLDITITTDVRENVVAVPLLATLPDPVGNSFAYVIADNNRLEQRFIEVMTHADMYVEVSGIAEGERLVAQPTLTMYEGMLVTPIALEG